MQLMLCAKVGIGGGGGLVVGGAVPRFPSSRTATCLGNVVVRVKDEKGNVVDAWRSGNTCQGCVSMTFRSTTSRCVPYEIEEGCVGSLPYCAGSMAVRFFV